MADKKSPKPTKTRQLDVRTLRTLARRFRRDAKVPRRNYEQAPKPPRSWPSDDTRVFSDGESRGYWRGWHCALVQLADEMQQEARALTRKKRSRP